jgi:hypothetical protein
MTGPRYFDIKEAKARLGDGKPVFIGYCSKNTGLQTKVRIVGIYSNINGGFCVRDLEGRVSEVLTRDRVSFSNS